MSGVSGEGMKEYPTKFELNKEKRKKIITYLEFMLDLNNITNEQLKIIAQRVGCQVQWVRRVKKMWEEGKS